MSKQFKTFFGSFLNPVDDEVNIFIKEMGITNFEWKVCSPVDDKYDYALVLLYDENRNANPKPEVEVDNSYRARYLGIPHTVYDSRYDNQSKFNKK